MLDISIVVPAIRQNRWADLYNSIKLSASKLNWELILVSPFDLPPELQNIDNLRLLKSHSSVSICIQLGSLEAKGKLLYHTVDDCVMFPDSINKAHQLYQQCCGHKDVVNMRYREGKNFSGYEFPMNFWKVSSANDLRAPGINPDWFWSVQPLLNKNYFVELGGLDCRFEYSNHGHHDLLFRIQKDDGRVFQSPTEVSNADHMPNITGDHAPIHYAQTQHDEPLFFELYNEYTDRIRIPYDNYKQYPELMIWKRRFPDKHTDSYVELTKERGYNI